MIAARRFLRALWAFLVTGGLEWRGRTMRPLWAVLGLAPLAAIYWPARRYVDWCDRRF